MNTLQMIMIAVFKNRPIMLSKWNAKNFRTIEDGIVFNVDAAQYSGAVEVVYEEETDTFSVMLADKGQSIDGVCVDVLVMVVDKMIECSIADAEYRQKMMQYLNECSK